MTVDENQLCPLRHGCNVTSDGVMGLSDSELYELACAEHDINQCKKQIARAEARIDAAKLRIRAIIQSHQENASDRSLPY